MLEWKDPGPAQKGPSAAPEWRTELISRPGEWAILMHHSKSNNASSSMSQRKRRYGPEGFEFCMRSLGPEDFALFGRFVVTKAPNA